MKCVYCQEPFIEGEPFDVINDGAERIHQECLLRMVIGSVGHQKRTCECFGGTEGDPYGATRRESALAAAAFYRGRADA